MFPSVLVMLVTDIGYGQLATESMHAVHALGGFFRSCLLLFRCRPRTLEAEINFHAFLFLLLVLVIRIFGLR